MTSGIEIGTRENNILNISLLTHVLRWIIISISQNDHDTENCRTVNFLSLQKEKQDLQVLVKEMEDNCQKLITESKEKSEEIARCENTVSIFHKL